MFTFRPKMSKKFIYTFVPLNLIVLSLFAFFSFQNESGILTFLWLDFAFFILLDLLILFIFTSEKVVFTKNRIFFKNLLKTKFIDFSEIYEVDLLTKSGLPLDPTTSIQTLKHIAFVGKEDYLLISYHHYGQNIPAIIHFLQEKHPHIKLHSSFLAHDRIVRK